MNRRDFASLALLAAPGAMAQTAYPDRAIRLVVSQPPGGTMDIVSRLVADEFQKRLGQGVVVENKPGATGNIAAEQVARSAPDGYTLIMATGATHTINPSLFKKLNYDAVKDFAPVSLLVSGPNVICVNPSVPAQSLKELIELARRQPGKLEYASAGYGATGQLALELLKARARISMVHIPYKGIAAAMQETIAGRVQVLAFPAAALGPHIESGKLRALAVTGDRRVAALPQVPTAAEQGLPDFNAVAWFGLMAPTGTPAEAIKRLRDESRRLTQDRAFAERMGAMGLDVNYKEGNDFARYLAADAAQWKEVIKFSGAQVE